MKLIKKLSRKRTADLILAAVKTVITKMTENALKFPNPDPTLLVLTGKYDAGMAKLAEINDTLATLKVLRSQRDAQMDDIMQAYGQLANYVEIVSKGDPSVIPLGGFSTTAEPATPAAPMQVQGLVVKAGSDDGQVMARWKRKKGDRSFEVQVAVDPARENWTHKVTSTKAKKVLTGLPSGTRCAVRVRAINSEGEGSWSDAINVRVP
jgi:hypothetical protein